MRSNSDREISVLRNIDWWTIAIYLILVVCGAFSIYAASYDFDNASIFDFAENSGKQFLWIGLGLLLGIVILTFNYRLYEAYAYPIYGAVLLLLMVTIVVAHDINGSRSWISFGSFSVQPAEFGKFATALALAKLFDSYQFNLNAKLSNYFKAGAIIMLPILLILAQKETGSALVYTSLIFVLYREGMSGLVLVSLVLTITYFIVVLKFTTPLLLGIPLGEFCVMSMILLIFVAMIAIYCKNLKAARNLLIGVIVSAIVIATLILLDVQVNGWLIFTLLIAAAIIYTVIEMMRHHLQKYLITIAVALISIGFMASVGHVFNNVIQEHQRTRIEVALGIKDEISGAGYNVNQSKIAIGSGGLTGKGFLNGTQTKLKYVPEQHTDFIFCTIGEEEGFVGTTLVLIAFTVLIIRLIHIAERQVSAFSRVYAYCVVSYLMFHLLINVGMVIGLCPVIGIPLPFFSYGGSSLWGFTILIFILLRLDAARKQ